MTGSTSKVGGTPPTPEKPEEQPLTKKEIKKESVKLSEEISMERDAKTTPLQRSKLPPSEETKQQQEGLKGVVKTAKASATETKTLIEAVTKDKTVYNDTNNANEADSILKGLKEGAYMLRPSSRKGSFALSINWAKGDVKHFRFTVTSEGFVYKKQNGATSEPKKDINVLIYEIYKAHNKHNLANPTERLQPIHPYTRDLEETTKPMSKPEPTEEELRSERTAVTQQAIKIKLEEMTITQAYKLLDIKTGANRNERLARKEQVNNALNPEKLKQHDSRLKEMFRSVQAKVDQAWNIIERKSR